MAVMCALLLTLFAPVQQSTGEEPRERGLAVAVVDFAVDDLAVDNLGSQIAQTVTILLANQPGLRMVDRSSLDAVLEEQQLSLTGLVDTHEAVRVGQLVGARIIVVGQVFQLGEQVFLTAKADRHGDEPGRRRAGGGRSGRAAERTGHDAEPTGGRAAAGGRASAGGVG